MVKVDKTDRAEKREEDKIRQERKNYLREILPEDFYLNKYYQGIHVKVDEGFFGTDTRVGYVDNLSYDDEWTYIYRGPDRYLDQINEVLGKMENKFDIDITIEVKGLDC